VSVERGKLQEPFPLSWISGRHPQLVRVSLPVQGVWFPYGTLPAEWTMEQVARYLDAQADAPIVVRGWPAEAVTLLQQRGWQCWQVGQEGRLPLRKPFPFCRKTRHAIRRGQRVAVFQRLPSGLATAKQMAALQREVLGRGVNHLQWLFRQPPDASLRLYVARSPSGQIWGALGISTNRPGFVQAEWMVRHPRAHFGVLDALVAYV